MSLTVKDSTDTTRTLATATAKNGDLIPVNATQLDGPLKIPFIRHLDGNGDGTGTKNWIGDYSSASDIAFIQPPAGQAFRIQKLTFSIKEINNAIRFDGGLYGASSLTTGILIRIESDTGTIVDLTDGVRIKSNEDIAKFGFNIFVDSTNDFLQATLEFPVPIRLDGDNDERLEVLVNDDFSALEAHAFTVQGYTE